MPLKKPIKPIYPLLVDNDSEVRCINFCDGGEDSEYTGVGNDRCYYKCLTCNGTGLSSGKEHNDVKLRCYNQDMERYYRIIGTQKILRTIKLNRKQREALKQYGVDNYLKETL